MAGKSINSTQISRKHSQFDARDVCSHLEQRIAVLETQVADAKRGQAALQRGLRELQDKLARIESSDETNERYDFGSWDSPPDKHKRGPKSRCDKESFRLFRDHLVLTLENYWPELEQVCKSIRRLSLERALQHIIARADSQQKTCADHLLKHIDTLLVFLRTDRFRGDPRQIANAMAGVPAIGIWRSLKLGQATPCREQIGQRALKDYIKRKHHAFYRNLETEVALPHFANARRAYRTKDPFLRNYHAAGILHAWKSSDPTIR